MVTPCQMKLILIKWGGFKYLCPKILICSFDPTEPACQHASRQPHAFSYICSVVTRVVASAEIVTGMASQKSIPSERKPFLSWQAVAFRSHRISLGLSYAFRVRVRISLTEMSPDFIVWCDFFLSSCNETWLTQRVISRLFAIKQERGSRGAGGTCVHSTFVYDITKKLKYFSIFGLRIAIFPWSNAFNHVQFL